MRRDFAAKCRRKQLAPPGSRRSNWPYAFPDRYPLEMSAGLSLSKHRRGIRDLGLNAAVALAYIAAGIAGLQFAFFNHNATSVWVPAGIALASLLLWGPRTLPAVALGAFAVNLWNTGQIGGAIGVSIGNSLEACAG